MQAPPSQAPSMPNPDAVPAPYLGFIVVALGVVTALLGLLYVCWLVRERLDRHRES